MERLRAAYDWLWALLMVALPGYFRPFNRQKTLHWIGIIVLFLCFQTVLTMGLTFLFAMDLGLLMEVTAAFVMLSLRGGLQVTVIRIRHGSMQLKRRALHAYRRGARAGRRIVRLLEPPPADDDRAAVFA